MRNITTTVRIAASLFYASDESHSMKLLTSFSGRGPLIESNPYYLFRMRWFFFIIIL